MTPAAPGFARAMYRCKLGKHLASVVHSGDIPDRDGRVQLMAALFGMFENWPLKSEQSVKMFPSMRRTGLDRPGYAQAVSG